jgi:hypothetical protein
LTNDTVASANTRALDTRAVGSAARTLEARARGIAAESIDTSASASALWALEILNPLVKQIEQPVHLAGGGLRCDLPPGGFLAGGGFEGTARASCPLRKFRRLFGCHLDLHCIGESAADL